MVKTLDRSKHHHRGTTESSGTDGRSPRHSQKPISPLSLRVPGIQTKLTVNQPGDKYEQEADAIAQQVVSSPAPITQPDETRASAPSIQRVEENEESIQRRAAEEETCTHCQQDILQRMETEDEPVQRQPEDEAIQRMAAEDDSIQRQAEEDAIQRKGQGTPNVSASTAAAIRHPGTGSPLPTGVRRRIEPHVRTNLSGVRVHSDRQANQAASSLNARAFTHSNHIFLNRTESSQNLGLMAHESTHVVQQTGDRSSSASVQRLQDTSNTSTSTERSTSTVAPSASTSPVTAAAPTTTTAPVAPTPRPSTPVTPAIAERQESETETPTPATENRPETAPTPPTEPATGGETEGEAATTIELMMPEAPNRLSAGARGRLTQAQNRSSEAAAVTNELPSAETNVGAARVAVTEPAEETQARASEALVDELGERAEPSAEIESLCKRIREIIASKRPPDEESLVEADPEAAANAAGDQLNQSIEGDVERVEGNYDELDETPTGTPPPAPEALETPPEQVETPEIGAAEATPDSIPAANVSLDADAAASAERIDAAGLNSEPAQLAAQGDPNSPMAQAQAAQGELETTSQQSPAEVLAEQQRALAAASADMADLQATALAALENSRTGTVTNVGGQQTTMVGTEEEKRTEVSRKAQEIFGTAQSEVTTKLSSLQSKAMNKWERGKAVLTTQFKQSLAAVERRVEEEYGDIIGQIITSITGLPDWATQGYDRAEKKFGDGVCELIREISSDVNSVIATCEELIADARREINTLFDNLPQELQEWATGERERFDEQLNGLQNQVTQTRDDLNKDLASRAAQSVQEVREEVHALREAAKGLIGQVTDALNQFAEDPAKFIIEGLLTLVGIAPPAFWAVVNKIDQAIDDIADDPLNFAGNLLTAVGQGFEQFFDNFPTHMLDGLMDWLFSGLGSVGVEIPTEISLKSIVTFFLQLMGISWARIRQLLAKHIGEENIALIEKAYELISSLIEMGPEGLFEMIKEKLDPQTILNQVIQAAVDYLTEALIKAVSARIVLLFNPVGAIAQAVEAIYRVLKWIFENAARIFSLVETIVNGITAIIAGDISGMATAVEQALSGLITPVVDFLADYMGFGDLPDKIAETIKGFQEWIEGLLDKVIEFLVDRAKALLRSLGIGKEETDDDNLDPTDHDAMATRAVNELEQGGNSPQDYASLRRQKEQQAAEIETKYSALLEEGIGMFISFQNEDSDKTDNDIDFKILIAPNNTEKEGAIPREIVEIEHEDLQIKVDHGDSSWDVHLSALVQGQDLWWGWVSVPLDPETKLPPKKPEHSMLLENRTELDGKPIKLKLKEGSFTAYALAESIRLYEETFETSLDELTGNLASKNLENFQKEFAKRRAEEMDSEPAAQEAIRSISFGTKRIDLGFSNFKVEMSDFKIMEIDKRPSYVPTKVKVIAKKITS